MVDQVRYWLRTGAPQSLTGRKIIEGLDPTDEHEALRRYLDEHERQRYAPPQPKCCSFCGEPASDERTADDNYERHQRQATGAKFKQDGFNPWPYDRDDETVLGKLAKRWPATNSGGFLSV